MGGASIAFPDPLSSASTPSRILFSDSTDDALCAAIFGESRGGLGTAAEETTWGKTLPSGRPPNSTSAPAMIKTIRPGTAPRNKLAQGFEREAVETFFIANCVPVDALGIAFSRCRIDTARAVEIDLSTWRAAARAIEITLGAKGVGVGFAMGRDAAAGNVDGDRDDASETAFICGNVAFCKEVLSGKWETTCSDRVAVTALAAGAVSMPVDVTRAINGSAVTIAVSQTCSRTPSGKNVNRKPPVFLLASVHANSPTPSIRSLSGNESQKSTTLPWRTGPSV